MVRLTLGLIFTSKPAQLFRSRKNLPAGPMNKNSCLLIPLLSTLFLEGCQGIPGLVPPGEDRSRIVITAQSGSEVVLTKNVHGSGPPNRAPDPEAAFPEHARPGAAALDVLPVPEERPDGDAVTPPHSARRHPPARRIACRALARAARRNPCSRPCRALQSAQGRTAQKPETYPVWEITTEASFEGEFEAALEWLMAGFEHTNPRPVLSLHPNGIVG